jgi:hypothetical protein
MIVDALRTFFASRAWVPAAGRSSERTSDVGGGAGSNSSSRSGGSEGLQGHLAAASHGQQ